MAVPVYNGKVVLEALDDRDGNGRPSKGEKFTVLHEMGKLSGAKSERLENRLFDAAGNPRRRSSCGWSPSRWRWRDAPRRGPSASKLRHPIREVRPPTRIGPLFLDRVA